MKKILLAIVAISATAITAFGQSRPNLTHPVNMTMDKTTSDPIHLGVPQTTSNKNTRGVGESLLSTIGTKWVVGKTTYDLQTNGALQTRILKDGANIHTAWTMSHETNVVSTSAFADRGTGYAFYNGTAWSTPPTARVENVRTGFGAMAKDGNGDLVYVAHDANNNIMLSRKSGTTWTTVNTGLTTTATAIWPDVATSGNWMYIMASTNDSMSRSNGIRNGFFFSRSNDNGATWLDNQIPMPLVDSTGHFRGGGNGYSIFARDSIVACAFGDMGTDLTLVTSTDYGATWTKKVIWDWPLENYNFGSQTMTDTNADLIPDTLWSQDGSFDITLDKNGDVHAAFPILRVYKDGSTTGYSFFYRTLMCYYNTAADSVQFVDDIFALHHDCDGDTVFNIGPNYISANNALDANYNTIGLLTMPEITVNDNNDDVYITYTCLMDNDMTEIDFSSIYWQGASALEGQNYRDIMVLGSDDKGATWTYPVNITRTKHYEEVYPSVPGIVSGADPNLHFIYQGDIEPGTILQNDDAYDPNFENWMIYQKVPIATIFSEGANFTAPCGQFELPLATTDLTLANGNVQIFPNPALDYITVQLDLNNIAKDVTYELYDMTGRLINTIKRQNVLNDKTQIDVRALSQGNYVLKVNADNKVSSHKLSIK